ncbi:DUF2231 domain-containing protein [uncultured Chitinophaga sp.]|jgi:Ferredoxin subunits of nitrite reductase and ring-hydroxylating dioxygenases|uniref:DUF2231 domain-containing protein n=1 Tax=uncultured Chitinophaga sp. TaxID=339340 RepID=UPI002639F886|nr:DUF2231 domain-containing protein [uncultured Chitinophaga sp.]
MKSTAHIKGHPLHPIAIALPIGFFIGTLVFDLLALVNNSTDLAFVAYCSQIAGVVSALLAAVPGIIDYLYTVPPQSSAKQRATRHGLLNVLNVVIFLAAWLMKEDRVLPSFAIVLMEIAGIVILSVAGWMGGTLVYRNQIGVDIRYAGAGKWKELHIDGHQQRVQVATAGELQTNQMKLVHVDDRRIVIGRTEKGFVAFDDRCTHKGGSLAGGAMMCGTVQCPWHGSQFDTESGQVNAGPAKTGITIYRVSEDNGIVYLIL